MNHSATQIAKALQRSLLTISRLYMQPKDSIIIVSSYISVYLTCHYLHDYCKPGQRCCLEEFGYDQPPYWI
jgi:hypothetical protein